jgi:transposase
LTPGDIVLMDNLASHKVPGILEAIEGAGDSLWYLPPYSPDLPHCPR